MSDHLDREFILKTKTADRPGIMARLAPLLAENGCDIRDAGVYGDEDSKQFFVRMHIACRDKTLDELAELLTPFAEEMVSEWSIHDLAVKQRVLLAVSKFDHCLVDIVHKWKIGTLPIDIVGVVSNHPDSSDYVAAAGLRYHHLPITKDTKPEQEAAFRNVIDDSNADLVVLARYMQILSDDFSAWLSGRCINIHHSFLPSFKGARPYKQAHDRGVKLIGATAHYVTADLDEGPIIEQDVRRVTHATTANEMVVIGRDVEASVLSRAIRWHAEHRVFLNGNKTIVL